MMNAQQYDVVMTNAQQYDVVMTNTKCKRSESFEGKEMKMKMKQDILESS